jgi:hypothetical protein
MALPFSGKKKYPQVNDNILEALRSISSNVGKTVAQDVVAKTSDNIFNSLIGNSPKQNEVQVNHETPGTVSEHARYSAFRPENPNRTQVRTEETGLKQQINAVRSELAALSKSINSLNTQIEKAITEVPVEPGIYHLNFFERLKTVIRMLRENIEDSRTWLATSSTRKSKRKYWGMYKKHGTTFGLSNERSLATQAG